MLKYTVVLTRDTNDQKLHWPIYEVDKPRDLNRPTPLDLIEAALSVLKKRLVLAVEDNA
jgi:hypothetical protein